MSNLIADKTYALFENPGTKKIIADLENAGVNILRFPLPATERFFFGEDSPDFLNRLKHFDWLIFSDIFTVEFFLQIFEEESIDFYELDETRVCVLGEAVSDKLRFVQLHADVIPPTLERHDIITALKNYIGENEFQRQNFLLLKESTAQSELKNELAELAQTSELSVYRIIMPAGSEIAKLKALLKGGAIDEFVFTAPSDFVWLNCLFGNEPLNRLLEGTNATALDGAILQAAREHKLEQAVLWRSTKIDKVKR